MTRAFVPEFENGHLVKVNGIRVHYFGGFDLIRLVKHFAEKERQACERIADMLRQDDGEAFFEAEKFLKRHAPDLYDKIGMSK